MASSISSSSSSSDAFTQGPAKRRKIDSSLNSSPRGEPRLLLPHDNSFNQTWFKDLNAYLQFDAINLSRVCRKARALQHQFRFTHLFRAVLSSPDFRNRLCRLKLPTIRHLNSETTSLVNQARSLKPEIELLKQTNPQGRELQQKIRESGKLVETYKRVGECVEQTLANIFTQSFCFHDLYAFNIDETTMPDDDEPFPEFRPWKARRISPTDEAVSFLSKLEPVVKLRINTLDFSGNILFSRYFDSNLRKEFSRVLRNCVVLNSSRVRVDRGIRHIIVSDELDGIDHGEYNCSTNGIEGPFVTYSAEPVVERVNLRALKGLADYQLIIILRAHQSPNTRPLQELRVSSMEISDKIFPFFRDGLEILDLDWRCSIEFSQDDPDSVFATGYGNAFNEHGLKEVNEEQVTSALKKSCNTLQELRMTQAAITGRFLNEAALYRLQKLHLCHCKPLDENWLAYFFARAGQLEDIDLSGTNTSGASLASINSPVKKLSLRRCSHLDPNALGVFLQTKAQSLESLDVEGTTIAGAFKNIPKLPNLKRIFFWRKNRYGCVNAFKDKEEVQTILDKCPKLDPETKNRLREELSRLSQDEDNSDTVNMAD